MSFVFKMVAVTFTSAEAGMAAASSTKASADPAVA
jgi:hypothetical protein